MMKVEEEPRDFAGHFHGCLENCHFCNQRTRFWNMHTNNPVCPNCAKTHSVRELPDHGKLIRAEKRRMKAGK